MECMNSRSGICEAIDLRCVRTFLSVPSQQFIEYMKSYASFSCCLIALDDCLVFLN